MEIVAVIAMIVMIAAPVYYLGAITHGYGLIVVAMAILYTFYRYLRKVYNDAAN